MNKRIGYVSIVLLTLVITSATGSVQSQEMDLSDYQELSYNMPTLGWDSLSYDAGPPISEQLELIGINVVDLPTDDSIMYPNLYDQTPEQPWRRYDMYEMSHGFRAWPDVIGRIHSDMDVDWGDNIYNLNEPEMDAVIDSINTAENDVALHAAVDEFQMKWAEYLPYIPLYLNDDVHAVASKWDGSYTWDMPAGGFGTYLNYLSSVTLEASDSDDSFVMAFPSDVRGTNPMRNTDGRSVWFHMNVYTPLFVYDKVLNPVPWLATSWSQEVVDAKTVVTYTIRDGAKWHDGMPVTAEDVAFTFLYGREADEVTSHYQQMRYVESAVVADNTVTVTLDSVRAFAFYELGFLPVLPKHIWDGVDSLDDQWQLSGSSDEAKRVHVGSGPFKYIDRIEGESFTLERFDDFWQPAKIKYMKMRVFATDAAAILAIGAGDADTMRYNLPASYVKTAQTTPGVTVYSYADMWDYVLGFNLETPGLDDYEVRKAIAYAIDREAIVNRAALGWGTPQDGPIPSAFFPGWYNPDTPQFTTGNQDDDIVMANQILDDARYIDVDGDGIREFPGAVHTTTGPSTITIVTSATETVTVAELSLNVLGVFVSGTIIALLAAKRKKK